MEKKRVIVVDDHPLVRKGLASLIEESPEFEISGDAGSREKGLELAIAVKPDLMVVDLALGSDDGLDLIKDVRSAVPSTQILVVSMQDELIFAERALRAGANGYLMKDESGDLVLAALKKVAEGGIYMSEAMSNRMLRKSLHPGEDLGADVTASFSDREMQVFRRLGEGQGTSKIAKELNLSIKTVEYYRDRLKSKLDLKTSAELLQFAIRWKQTVSPN